MFIRDLTKSHIHISDKEDELISDEDLSRGLSKSLLHFTQCLNTKQGPQVVAEKNLEIAYLKNVLPEDKVSPRRSGHELQSR